MKTLRSPVSAQPCLGSAGGRPAPVLGSVGSSGSDGRARSERSCKGKAGAAPSTLPRGCPCLWPAPRHRLSAEQGGLVPCAGLKSYSGSDADPGTDLPCQPGANRPATRFGCLMLCHPPHLHFSFLRLLHYNCTVLKSCHSLYRIAAAARKLTIQRSISNHFFGHVLWPATGGILQILTWTNK